jgi:hypothetical protein
MSKDNKSEKLDIIAAFVHELMNTRGGESVLHVCISNFSVFSSLSSNFKVVSGFDWRSKIADGEKYDFIFGDFPLGMGKREDCKIGSETLKIRQNWVEIVKSINLLNDNGLALYLVEPIGFSASEGKKLEDALNSEGYFVNAILNAPERILQPETTITPVFVLISKKKTNTIFIAELLSESQGAEIARKFCSGAFGKDLKQGLAIEEKTFYGFDRIRIKQQIEKLETQYKEYEEYTIGEIAKEINHVKQGDSLIEKDNSVYIPKIGNSSVVSNLSDTTIKHHNYFQVVIGEKAINGYVEAFFRSDLGRLVLQSLTSGAVIPHLSKSDLEQATIALPSFDDQKQILATQQKLSDLKQAIDNFDSELALNPTRSQTILAQLDSMLEAIRGLTEADEIRNLTRQGESKRIEFKETLNLDVKKQTKEKYIELSALKTIVAFLNTEGGALLVGVSDDGKISGIDIEIDKFHKGSTDKFLLHFKNLLKTRIGEEFYPYIEYKLVFVAENRVLIVKCKESKSPCYLDNAEFYVRTNPATDKLEGPKLVQYVKNHFSV